MNDPIRFLNGQEVPEQRIWKVKDQGPRSPAFYLDLDEWKEDKHIYEQLKKAGQI